MAGMRQSREQTVGECGRKEENLNPFACRYLPTQSKVPSFVINRKVSFFSGENFLFR